MCSLYSGGNRTGLVYGLSRPLGALHSEGFGLTRKVETHEALSPSLHFLLLLLASEEALPWATPATMAGALSLPLLILLHA